MTINYISEEDVRTIYSKEDSRQLADLNGQLSDYDAALLSRLIKKFSDKTVSSLNASSGFISRELEIEFLNDLGRREILTKIERFYAVTMPLGIGIDKAH